MYGVVPRTLGGCAVQMSMCILSLSVYVYVQWLFWIVRDTEHIRLGILDRDPWNTYRVLRT